MTTSLIVIYLSLIVITISLIYTSLIVMTISLIVMTIRLVYMTIRLIVMTISLVEQKFRLKNWTWKEEILPSRFVPGREGDSHDKSFHNSKRQISMAVEPATHCLLQDFSVKLMCHDGQLSQVSHNY
jgi:hypothetical protein